MFDVSYFIIIYINTLITEKQFLKFYKLDSAERFNIADFIIIFNNYKINLNLKF
jgi:hypothetical protein